MALVSRATAAVFCVGLLLGCAQAGSKAISASPSSVSFGTKTVNTTSSQTVVVTNTGRTPVGITSATINGPSVFSLSGWSGQVNLRPSQSLQLVVGFSPTAAGNYSGTLDIIGTGSTNLSVGITGAATSPTSTVAVSISPTSAALQTATSQQFAATVTGTTNTSVSWLVNGTQGGNTTVGTISSSGLYTAPASVPSGGSVTVTAQSMADTTKSANAAVTIMAAPTPVTVSVSPQSATLQPSATQQFVATVSGTTNTSVLWAVNGVAGGGSTTGTISGSGLYTAPASVPSNTSVTVTATSAYDTSSSGSATVNLLAPSHYASLAWTASASTVAGYNVYRSSQSAGPYTRINSSLATQTTYTDNSVQSGQTYYYVTTAVDSNGVESGYSNTAQAIVP